VSYDLAHIIVWMAWLYGAVWSVNIQFRLDRKLWKVCWKRDSPVVAVNHETFSGSLKLLLLQALHADDVGDWRLEHLHQVGWQDRYKSSLPIDRAQQRH
jgi:hypothetical protein